MVTEIHIEIQQDLSRSCGNICEVYSGVICLDNRNDIM